MTDSHLHFPALWFSMFNTTNDSQYSVLVKLNQHVKQLRVDRNSKEINLPKLNVRIVITEHDLFPWIWYLKGHFSQTQTLYVFKVTEHNILCDLKTISVKFLLVITMLCYTENGREQLSNPVLLALKVTLYRNCTRTIEMTLPSFILTPMPA